MGEECRHFLPLRHYQRSVEQAVKHDGDIELFKKDKDDKQAVNVNDIKQGRLGNCWFIAATGALAEFPEAIQDIFIGHEYREGKDQKVKLFVDGRWQVITVDGKFPRDLSEMSLPPTEPELNGQAK